MSLNQLKTILFIIVLGFSIIKSTSSFADTYTPPVEYRLAQTPPMFNDQPIFSTSAQACIAQVARYRTNSPANDYELLACDVQPTSTALYFRIRTIVKSSGSTTTSSATGVIAGQRIQQCAAGYTASGISPPLTCTGSCAPPLVYNAVTNSCAPDGGCTPPNVFNETTQSCSPEGCLSKKGQSTTYQLNFGLNSTNPYTSGDTCQQSCVAFPVNGHCGFNPQKTNYACIMDGIFDGNTCAGSDTASAPDSDPATDCVKSGKSYGTVNGVVVCTAIGTPGSEPIKTVQSDSKNEVNADGTTTSETKETTESGGEVVQVIKTINEDGTETTETKKQTKQGFCEENPNSKICQQGKSACASDPESASCKHFCQKFPDTIACKTPTELIGDSSTLDQSDLSITERNFPSTIANITLPQSNGCPPDYSVSIGGRTIPFSYSWLCQYASSFKPLVIAVSLLSAALLVFGSIRQQGT